MAVGEYDHGFDGFALCDGCYREFEGDRKAAMTPVMHQWKKVLTANRKVLEEKLKQRG